MAALALGLLFNLVVDDDLALHFCLRHEAEALLVARAVTPVALSPTELELLG